MANERNQQGRALERKGRVSFSRSLENKKPKRDYFQFQFVTSLVDLIGLDFIEGLRANTIEPPADYYTEQLPEKKVRLHSKEIWNALQSKLKNHVYQNGELKYFIYNNRPYMFFQYRLENHLQVVMIVDPGPSTERRMKNIREEQYGVVHRLILFDEQSKKAVDLVTTAPGVEWRFHPGFGSPDQDSGTNVFREEGHHTNTPWLRFGDLISAKRFGALAHEWGHLIKSHFEDSANKAKNQEELWKKLNGMLKGGGGSVILGEVMKEKEYKLAKKSLIENERGASKRSLLFLKTLLDNGFDLGISLEDAETELQRALKTYEDGCRKLENNFQYHADELTFLGSLLD